MKLAIFHEILTEYGGAERTLEAVHELYSGSPIFTLLYDQRALPSSWKDWQIYSSSLERHPLRGRWRLLRPFMPSVVEQFDLTPYDVVLSFSSAFGHGILTTPKTLHINYYHAPMRFAWDYAFPYAEEHHLNHGLTGLLARSSIHRLRMWDLAASLRPELTIANSNITAQRIKHYYRRPVDLVLNPPVETSRFYPNQSHADYFLVVSRLSAYKHVALAVQACNDLKLPLVIVGDGPERKRLANQAGSTVELVGFKPDDVVAEYIENCRAVLFLSDDDFGIVPVEAMSAGKPVIAFNRSGARETIIPGKTGLLFTEQTVDSLKATLTEFLEQDKSFDSLSIHQHASKWDKTIFQQKLGQFVDRSYKVFRHD